MSIKLYQFLHLLNLPNIGQEAITEIDQPIATEAAMTIAEVGKEEMKAEKEVIVGDEGRVRGIEGMILDIGNLEVHYWIENVVEQ
jgi:hypothetical protein